MAVGVVAGDAAVQPEGFRHAQERAEDGLVVGAVERRVAVLRRAQQALFRRQHQAGPVHVDAAAFEDHPPAAVRGANPADLARLGDERGGAVVERPVRVLGPGVKAPVEGDFFAGGGLDEDRAGVAQPAPVGGERVEPDVREVGPHVAEDPPGGGPLGGIGDEQVDDFVPGQGADDLAVHPRDRGEPARPVGPLVRPRQPGAVVRLPLGGHAEVGCGRVAHADGVRPDRTGGIRMDLFSVNV